MTGDFAPRRMRTFFYGSFMAQKVRAGLGVETNEFAVARLWGFDVRIDPLTRITKAERGCVYGLTMSLDRGQLARLYTAPWMEDYAPEAVMVERMDGASEAALCYYPDSPSRAPDPPPSYLETLLAAAVELGFPRWYVSRLEARGL